MRLIDTDELLKHEIEADRMGAMLVVGKGYILSAPEIDVVAVVRCGECQYRQKAKVNRKGFLICPTSGMEITENDYCSYGEIRKVKP